MFGEFEAQGVVRLFISPGESGCVNIFVAALLEDGRLIVRVLDYEHKRFHEAWGQTRMEEESDETSELFGGDMVPDFEGY